MNLADKPCYPYQWKGRNFDIQEGLTFRERLIIALASNPNICANTDIAHDLSHINMIANADEVVSQADEIIKRVEKG
jgi:hypothetical protein